MPMLGGQVEYKGYSKENNDLDRICQLVESMLSEPYSLWTYYYFLEEYPHLCRTAWIGDELIAVVMARIGLHKGALRGYIGMLAVHPSHRGKGIGSTIVSQVLERMILEGVNEIVLEAEVSNVGALNLYAKLGFVREKRLENYYLNGSDAFRLKLWTS